jgi:tRNA-binding protein
VEDQIAAKPQISFGKFENVDLRTAVITSAKMAAGTRFPCRVLGLDLGPLGERTSIGQFALVSEDQLVGMKVVACVNLGARQMGEYLSEVLVLGTRHPNSPTDQAQALPLAAAEQSSPGEVVF